MGVLTKAVAASVAAAAGAAYFGPSVLDHIRPHLQPLIPLRWSASPTTAAAGPGSPWVCESHGYTTQLVSLDPLLMYISNFVQPSEAAAIIDIGTPLLVPSPLTGYGSDTAGHKSRTSWSAPLPVAGGDDDDDAAAATSSSAVDCVLSRAASVLGTLLLPGRDDMGRPQMVRYTAGQKFDAHRDWFARPRVDDADAATGRRRMYNRVATVFVVLQANNTGGGETWFPLAKPIAGEAGEWDSVGGGEGKERVWREHEEGGLAFRAIPGNALVWVNMFPNGTGDGRTLHAGLPVEDGVKTAMNIWPRVYFGPDA